MRRSKQPKDFNRSIRAFTLIEMVIAISVATLFIGSFALILGSIYTESDIRQPATKLEILAQRVRTIATVHQRTYQIFLTEKGLYILPYGENPKDHPQAEWNFLAQKDAEREPPLSHPTVREFHEVEETIDFLIKGWGMQEFRKLDQEFSYAWQFEPNGMIEPVSVRFELDDGENVSWLQQTYHPMTGTVNEEESEIYD